MFALVIRQLIFFQEKEYPDIFAKIGVIADKQEKWKAIDFHAAEIEKKIGLESVEVVHSENTDLWDWAKKAGQTTSEYTFGILAHVFWPGSYPVCLTLWSMCSCLTLVV